jgi:hypothetical protein
MKKLAGVEVVEAPEIKPDEFLFSTGEKMSFKVGKKTDKEVNAAVNMLTNHAHFIAKHSDKNVILPADLESQIRDQVEALNAKGFVFRFYLRVGADIISEERLRELTDPDSVYKPLWKSGSEENSYTVEELNGSTTGISVMGAFVNAEATNYDPILHLLGHTWDDKYSNGKITQVQAAKEFIASERDDELETSQTDHRDTYSMYIMDKNNGGKINNVILAQGWMRIPLGRRSVVGGSFVGDVVSHDGRWKLDRDNGDAYDDGGVSFSAGLAD